MERKANTEISFAFFGTGSLSVIVLDELKKEGFLPKLIVTYPDKPVGRKMLLTESETKTWAKVNNIPYIEIKKISEEAVSSIKNFEPFDLFIVVSFGKIIPDSLLEIPKFKTLNLHPSLLPKLRGASPIKSAILEEKETGFSIMRLDNELDHGPIVFQSKVNIVDWPPYEEDLEKILGIEGGRALAKIIPDWMEGSIKEVEQEHSKATFCGKIKKEDGQLNLKDDPEKNLRKIRSFHRWPGAYFFDNGKRIIVKKAKIEDSKLKIERVIPEGKKEMDYEDYLRGNKF